MQLDFGHFRIKNRIWSLLLHARQKQEVSQKVSSHGARVQNVILYHQYQYSHFPQAPQYLLLKLSLKIIFIIRDYPSIMWAVLLYMHECWFNDLFNSVSLSEVKKYGTQPGCPWSCSTSSSWTLHGREPRDLKTASNKRTNKQKLPIKLYYLLPTVMDGRVETLVCICVLIW